MKTLLAALLVAATSASLAQSGGMKGMDMEMKKDGKGMPMHDKCMDMKGMDMQKCMDMMKKDGMKPAAASGKAPAGQIHTGSGVVKSVDKAKGTVTLAHEPIASMSWPSMTMAFKVKDKALLDKAKPGAKVQFAFVQSGKDSLITEIK